MEETTPVHSVRGAVVGVRGAVVGLIRNPAKVSRESVPRWKPYASRGG